MTPDHQQSVVLANVSQAVDTLLGEYALALDWQDWSKWLGLFAPECRYAVFSRQDAESNLPLGYMIDDCHARLVDRIKFITEVWAGTIEPYRSRHIIQRVSMKRIDDENYEILANMLVTYTENDEPSRMLATGYYHDVVCVTGEGAFFTSKTVYMDGTPARYLAYPL